MFGHVDDRAVWITNEEPTQSPLLFRDWVHDVCTGGEGTLVHILEVIDLDRNGRVDLCASTSSFITLNWTSC